MVLALGAATGCDRTFLGILPPVARVRIIVAGSVLRVGQSVAVLAEVYDREGAAIHHRRRAAVLASRDPAVAAVVGLGSGTLTGVAPGAVWIVAESGGVRDSIRVTVTP